MWSSIKCEFEWSIKQLGCDWNMSTLNDVEPFLISACLQ